MVPINKVKDIINKHDSLEKELSSGSIDPKLFANKSKEYSSLGSIIKIARKYVNFEGEKKDLAPLVLSKKEFNFIIKNFPNTDYAYDAKYKIDLINDTLAAKEVYIGRHYIKKKKWIPALNRFKNVLEEYETTIHVEEAIHRLVEIYYKLGMEEESLKYASLLGYNYNSGEWYKETYKIFNRNWIN